MCITQPVNSEPTTTLECQGQNLGLSYYTTLEEILCASCLICPCWVPEDSGIHEGTVCDMRETLGCCVQHLPHRQQGVTAGRHPFCCLNSQETGEETL